jgi:DNA-nicking Smr family endonuclease
MGTKKPDRPKGGADPGADDLGADDLGRDDLGRDDMALWRRAMRDAQPLERKGTLPRKLAPLPTARPQPLGPVPAPLTEPVPARRSGSPRPSPLAPPALAPGAVKDIDGRTAERRRRGELAIDGRIDLHGHTVVEAHQALAAFIDRAWRTHQRCLLVITGKGRGQGTEFSVGVIKSSVPRWLNEPGLRARILAFAGAQPKDGGGGALYVLLKRQR